jgi:hypothetical protein
MPIFRNALAQQPANMLAYQGTIGAPPRNEYLGALADFIAQSYSPVRTQQMQGVAKFFGAPEISQTLDRLSYGEPLTTGAGGLGGTTRIRPEALEAAMAVAPLAQPATMATLQAARAARQAALRAGMAGERYAERVVPQIMERGGLPAQLLQDLAQGTQSPLIVYHGSPHKFSKFDSSKIGTGEGAQAYGHGLYFAESPGVAESYQKTLAPKNYASIVQNGRNDYSVIAKDGTRVADGVMLGQAHKAKDAFDAAQTGSLYKVDLPDEQIAKMLDFDKPLSQQKNILEALTPENMGLTLRPSVDGGFMAYLADGKPIGLQVKGVTPEVFRERWINRLKEMGDLEGGAGRAVGYLGGTVPGDLPPLVAKALRQAGISGIRYLDSGSRGTGKGSSNFVVFPGEEKSMTILERNGQPANALVKNKTR